MIYTVTFNPSLDYMISVNDFELGKTNRTNKESLVPGGKGINVSTVLMNLGIESTALGYIAGFTGEEIEKQLIKTGIHTDFIKVDQGMSRINVKLKSIDGTEINGNGPKLSKSEVEILFEQLKQLKKDDILVLAGSIPSSLPSDIYSNIMEMLLEKEILFVVDATKDLLMNVLQYHPFLIKPNHHELGELFNVELNTREDVIPYGQKLQERGARNVLISMAGEGAVLIDENGKVYSQPAPKGVVINSVGAGDSMVAGFIKGWLEKADYEYAFHMGIAAGSASAFSENLATKNEIEKIYRGVLESDTL